MFVLAFWRSPGTTNIIILLKIIIVVENDSISDHSLITFKETPIILRGYRLRLQIYTFRNFGQFCSVVYVFSSKRGEKIDKMKLLLNSSVTKILFLMELSRSQGAPWKMSSKILKKPFFTRNCLTDFKCHKCQHSYPKNQFQW